METWPEILKLIQPENRPGDSKWFSVQAVALYLPMRSYIKWRLQDPKPPDGELGPLYHQARQINRHAWNFMEDPDLCPISLREERNKALEVSRLWFTELFAREIKSACGLHILRDLRFKLCV